MAHANKTAHAETENESISEMEASEAAVPPSDLPKTLQDVGTHYAEGEDIAKLVPLVQHLHSLTNPLYNFDPNAEFPAGYGLMVLPIGETVPELKDGKPTGKNKRVTKHVAVAAVPGLGVLVQHEAGKNYVADAVKAAISAKLRNAFTRVENPHDQETGVKLPFTIEQFIEKGEKGAEDLGLGTYNELATGMVKAIRNMGISLDKAILRQCLQSTAFAKGVFPAVDQSFWVLVLNKAVAVANEKGLKDTIFRSWLNTRDTNAKTTQEITADNVGEKFSFD